MKAVFIIGAFVVVILIGLGLYLISQLVPTASTGEALTLGVVVLAGLIVVVALMAGLAAMYSLLGIQADTHALALPEGSVRALIAFSLVLMFVCLSAFLYKNTSSSELVLLGKVSGVSASEITALRRDFAVVAEPALRDDRTPLLDTAGQPLYNATYFSRASEDADNFAMQIFTTLATVFVSVISFYFGSSTTRSAVDSGAKAATGATGGAKKDEDSSTQAGPTAAQQAASQAQSAAKEAKEAAARSAQLAATAAAERKAAAEADAAAAQKQADAASQAARQAAEQSELARRAADEAKAAGSDAPKAEAAAASLAKAGRAAQESADVAKRAAAEAARLLKKIETDTGKT